ncbi:uncharacterized protein B0H18DRAFT_1114158 [Fomitopsis serialis]|uniref:uncharacterized protein n=1 Tax=Fomitopsis serialis TaxID=139415 RepID=UPI002008A884|nr:uncharacterized protein B0H18DRAFT_1114158 [Neoantrodia serialis]KAH9935404.1 hypothetical protein B0H18DRAFT_1114158 [Neoantrodia serialis]
MADGSSGSNSSCWSSYLRSCGLVQCSKGRDGSVARVQTVKYYPIVALAVILTPSALLSEFYCTTQVDDDNLGIPPNSHPWFREPSLKRKTLEDDDISVVEFPQTRPVAQRPKRRRCDNIEHGLAQMTLNRSSVSPPPPPSRFNPIVELPPAAQVPQNSYYESMAHAPSVQETMPPLLMSVPSPVVLPGSVEEPASPEQTRDVPDVRMKIPSWYEVEKDRIVITDLEDSDTEDQEERKGSRADAEYTVSTALLDRLPIHAPSLPPPSSDSDPSKALVLFRPLVVASAAERETDASPGDGRQDDMESDAPTMDLDTPMDVDDAMDIEPL